MRCRECPAEEFRETQFFCAIHSRFGIPAAANPTMRCMYRLDYLYFRADRLLFVINDRIKKDGPLTCGECPGYLSRYFGVNWRYKHCVAIGACSTTIATVCPAREVDDYLSYLSLLVQVITKYEGETLVEAKRLMKSAGAPTASLAKSRRRLKVD